MFLRYKFTTVVIRKSKRKIEVFFVTVFIFFIKTHLPVQFLPELLCGQHFGSWHFGSWAEEWGPCTTKCTRNLENASLNPENARKRWNPSCPVFFLVQKDLDLEWKIENAQLKCTKKSQMYQEIGISQFSVSSKSSHTTIDHRPYDQVTAIQHDDAEHR